MKFYLKSLPTQTLLILYFDPALALEQTPSCQQHSTYFTEFKCTLQMPPRPATSDHAQILIVDHRSGPEQAAFCKIKPKERCASAQKKKKMKA